MPATTIVGPALASYLAVVDCQLGSASKDPAQVQGKFLSKKGRYSFSNSVALKESGSEVCEVRKLQPQRCGRGEPLFSFPLTRFLGSRNTKSSAMSQLDEKRGKN